MGREKEGRELEGECNGNEGKNLMEGWQLRKEREFRLSLKLESFTQTIFPDSFNAL